MRSSPLQPGVAQRSCALGIGEKLRQGVPDPDDVTRLEQKPGLAVCDNLRDGADAVATIGSDASIASRSTRPKPSHRDVCAKTLGALEPVANLAPAGKSTDDPSPSEAASARVSCSSGPMPRIARRASGLMVAGTSEGAQQGRDGPSAQ